VQPPTKSVSASIATVNSGSSLHSNGSSMGHMGTSGSNGSMHSGLGSSSSLATSFASASSDDMLNLPTSVLAQIAQQYANGDAHPVKPPTSTASITSQFVSDGSTPHGRMSEHGPRYMISEESWKHHAQARAILGNLIGPNGEQLTSTDPYNTTVFVGGLSPLINEDTLRTFFAPFGDIHYVRYFAFERKSQLIGLRRSKCPLGSIAALSSLFVRQTQSGRLRRCKDSQLVVVGFD